MLISICIPTYNRSQSLLNCLNSLCLQTNNSFEVCISDNCSDYNAEELIEPFRKKLKLIPNKNKYKLIVGPFINSFYVPRHPIKLYLNLKNNNLYTTNCHMYYENPHFKQKFSIYFQ